MKDIRVLIVSIVENSLYRAVHYVGPGATSGPEFFKTFVLSYFSLH